MKKKYCTALTVSFLIIALTVSLLIYSIVGRHLDKLQQNMVYECMYAAGNSIYAETEIMHDIAIDITMSGDYRYSYVSKQKYNEYALLLDLPAFNKRLNSTTNYFLMYKQDSDGIFSSDGYKWSYKVFTKERLRPSIDASRLNQHLRELSCEEIIPLGNGKILISYPIVLTVNSSREQQAVLSFVIDGNYFKNILDKYTQHLDCECRILYAQNIIAETGAPVENGRRLEYELDTRAGTLVLQADYKPYNAGFILENMQLMETLMLAAVILAVILLAVALANISIKPFKKLLYMLNPNAVAGRDVLDKLEKTIKESQSKTEAGTCSLREMLIHRLLFEGVEDRYTNLLQLSGIDLHGECYAVALIPEEENGFRDSGAAPADGLSSDSFSLYSAYLEDRRLYAVLIVLESEAYLNDATDSLISLCDTESGTVLSSGPIYQSDLIHVETEKLLERYKSKTAMNEQNTDIDAEGCSENEQDMELSEETAQLGKKMIQFVTEGYRSRDMSLKLLSEQFSLTANHCGLVFRKACGYPYKQYLTRLRLTEAARLLKETNMSIHDISEYVGYGKVTNFINKFSEEYGDTPLVFRQNEKER